MKEFRSKLLMALMLTCLPTLGLAADLADKIDGVGALIPSPTSPVVLGLTLLLEVVLRALPTQKPWSILHLVGRVIRSSGALLVKVADLVDKVVPQNAAQKGSA